MTWASWVNHIHPLFPNITETNCSPTSTKSSAYNCIAWACGKDEAWFEPDASNEYFWPIDDRSYTVAAYIKLFSSIGYNNCADSSLETGFLKIALYIDKEGLPSHAARQILTGKWTSKLGPDIDIEHDCPEVLNGPLYGEARIFMKREKEPSY